MFGVCCVWFLAPLFCSFLVCVCDFFSFYIRFLWCNLCHFLFYLYLRCVIGWKNNHIILYQIFPFLLVLCVYFLYICCMLYPVFRFSLVVVFLSVFVISFHFISCFYDVIYITFCFTCISILLMVERTNHIIFYLIFPFLLVVYVDFLICLVYVVSGF